MRAVRSTPPGVTVVDVDEPDGPGELISISSASICASDFGYIQWGSQFVLGHELAGTTDDGRTVAIEAIFGCGECDLCLDGRYNLCATTGTTALGIMADGGMSERFRVPARSLVELPADLAPRDACLVEPTAVAWHTCRLAGAGPDQRVCVVGGGAIGLMAVAAARAMGGAEVSLEARYPHQIELGERLGATQPSGLYDVVIEAAGSESALHRCTELARAERFDGRTRRVRARNRLAAAAVLHEGATYGAGAGVLQARARARLRGRRQPPGVDAAPGRGTHHPPLPHRGRRGGVPGRRRQVDGRAAGRDRAVVMNVMNHLGQCVADLERSRTFYERALGFEFWRILELDDEPSNRLLRLELPLGFRACYLRAGPFVLELLHYAGTGAAPAPYRARTMNEIGLTHISLSVDDIPATCALVEQHGGEVLTDTDVGGGLFVKDPDGQLIELLPMAYAERVATEV